MTKRFPYVLLFLLGFFVTPATAQDATFRGDAAHTGVYAGPAIHQFTHLRWSFPTDGPIRSTPAVSGNTVYAGSGDGHLYALDVATGQQRWRFETVGVGLNENEWPFDRKALISSPAVSSGLVAVGSRDGFLYAVEAASGKERWRFDYNVSWVLSSPAIYQGTVYTGTSDGQFFNALDLQTGQEQWRTPTQGTAWTSPAVADGVVYFGSDQRFYVLDAATGATKWSFRTLEGYHASPIVHDGTVFVGGNDGVFYALAGRTTAEGGRPASHKAFYWVEDPHFPWFGPASATYLRNTFQNDGYEALNDSSLAAFMQARIADRAPSVVVFLSHKLPRTVMQDTSKTALVRRYLDAAGKVVWLTPAPPAFRRDPVQDDVRGIDFTIPERLFDVRYSGPDTRGMGGVYVTRITPEGRRWGLRMGAISRGSVDPASVTTVLAMNEDGTAGAWVKNYGGPEGTGLVQLYLDRFVLGDLSGIKFVIERGLY